MTDCGCDKAKAELEEYLHREVSEVDYIDISEHLASCTDCSEEHLIGIVLTQFLTSDLADELHLVVAPFFVGTSRARRFVGDGAFPWNPGHRAHLAETRQIGDVVLLRYALSSRYDQSA